MYLTNALLINSGPIDRLILTPQFREDGSPKPIVLVGGNGSGKTSLLSVITDALIELAALHFQNITPSFGAGREYFRVLGGRTQRSGTNFELSALRFTDGAHEFHYRAKVGDIDIASISGEMQPFGPIANWSSANDKIAVGPVNEINRIYESGVLALFPSTRFEVPYWANSKVMDREPQGDFTGNFQNTLSKQIVVESGIQSLKPWIMNLMLDMIVNGPDIFALETIENVKTRVMQNQTFTGAYQKLTNIIQAILRNPNARIYWLGRIFGERRLTIVADQQILMPTIDCLSSGQSTLLSVFGTVLRYADTAANSLQIDQTDGIVMIDEIDAHLHADLQHEALPELIKYFRKSSLLLPRTRRFFLSE